MKFSTIFQTVAAVATTGFVTVMADNATADEAECGFGGLYQPDLMRLPDNIDRDSIRKCKEHPLGSATALLGRRDCYHDAPFGCTDGYCWKQCGATGSGQWCWTAGNGGFGEWIGCSTNQQCNQQQDCGVGPGDCGSCGCSC
ncbi:uncharacterized protein B0I36DRAFT_433113 [Microdochium trichocladiopsis]|uniref:IDI-2 n=1 Tax=Microdochium trichocladiopsis TaxID=1682393 RepID=A0A9P9BNP3_9PEZI|nr:uncharacterized protein B0I36DRAFT_433113 [Microdochium trichocladiopsis]KAH7027953.1 hypothetical protein B0I36DRAFT_433113 [Microdochium trichocladiopsis]